MTTFNIGDNVRVTNYGNSYFADTHIGKTGVVTAFEGPYVTVTRDSTGDVWVYKPSELELVESDAPSPTALRARAADFDAEASRQFDVAREAQFAAQAAQGAAYAAQRRAALYRAVANDLESS